jgi:heme/copper-type cytochrome/quinol oxidase subunit 2
MVPHVRNQASDRKEKDQMAHSKNLAAALLAVTAVAGLSACGGSDTGSGHDVTENQNATPKIVVKNGEPVGGVQELEYSAGDQIRFEVDSDVADEIHVHGYDVTKDVPAGGSIAFSVPAEIEGIFEVELEGRKEQIAELRVNP